MDVTEAFEARAEGHQEALSELLPLVYEQLRVLAERYMRRERAGHSLRPSDLVHEAYLKLIDANRVSWQGKTHFLAVSARQMRRILVDHARSRKARRHGGGLKRVILDEGAASTGEDLWELLALLN